jgi:A/G-specific adenine glycosylase
VPIDDASVAHEALFAWIAPRLRQLPWRETRDPWAVLVSEVMLQQTGVDRVLPKWKLFIETFPSATVCADASLGEILTLWQGLGYPRRARNLHASARRIVEEHGGRVPANLDKLLALPGVGPYTARAVLAFAHEVDVAVVDTNIARVLARMNGRRLTASEAQRIADTLVPEGEAWLWNQALMDLGATLCRPRPMCDACPLAPMCDWAGEGDDPSIGSAGVSTGQPRFEGSDRQARGRLMKALVSRAVSIDDVAEVMGRDEQVAARLLGALIDEGLVMRDGARVRLP